LSDDKFWVGELFDAVDNYIGLGFAKNILPTNDQQ